MVLAMFDNIINLAMNTTTAWIKVVHQKYKEYQ